MINENVGTVLQALIDNNARVGRQAVGGYRSATEYVVGRFDSAFKKLRDSAPKVRRHGKAQRALGFAGERVTGYCGKAFGKISDTADKIVDRADATAASGIDSIAARVSKVENPRVAQYVSDIGRVTLPPLRLARDVSAWIATRAEKRLGTVKRSAPIKKRTTRKSAKKAAR